MFCEEASGAKYGKQKDSHRNRSLARHRSGCCQAFLARGYNVVATSRSVSKAAFAKLRNLALVDGDIGQGGAYPVDRRTPSDERSRAFLR